MTSASGLRIRLIAHFIRLILYRSVRTRGTAFEPAADQLITEDILMHDERIAAAIMFGRHHMETGVLIQPSPSSIVQVDDAQARAEFIDRIWYV